MHQSWSGKNSIMNTGLVKVLKSASAQQTYTCKFFYSEFSKLILHKSTLFFFFLSRMSSRKTLWELLIPKSDSLSLGDYTLRLDSLAGGWEWGGCASSWWFSIRPTRWPSSCSSVALPDWTYRHCVLLPHTLPCKKCANSKLFAFGRSHFGMSQLHF